MPELNKAGQAPQRKPDVIVGDEVFVHHPKGPFAGKVAAHGEHGVTLDVAGKTHTATWDRVLGHKRRARQEYQVHDQGEDGMIVRDRHGTRQYLTVPPEAREEQMVIKAHGQAPRIAMLLKAAPTRPGLQKKSLTDKNGTSTTRWVRNSPDIPAPQPGHHVGWQNGEHQGHGRVMSAGKDGVVAQDQAGGTHRVMHQHVTHRWSDNKSEPPHSPHDAAAEAAQAQKDQDARRGDVQAHDGDADSFSAHDFAQRHDDPNVTVDGIVAEHGGDAAQRLQQARERVAKVKGTKDVHHDGSKWSPERAELHRKLLYDGVTVNGKTIPGMLSPERIKGAIPAEGEQPVFIALGGRGGSGKSSLNGRVYDESRAIVVDSDHIKGMLPEYEGWNAHGVHEESGEIAEKVIAIARLMGLNIVLDATMKGAGTEQMIDDFNAHGYRTEAHYMHLPRQHAARRAIGRFLRGGEKGRFVPPEVVLGNTQNERNFDAIKGKVHAWSFHDNQGEKGAGPTLIANKGDPATVKKQVAPLQKALPYLIIVTNKRSA